MRKLKIEELVRMDVESFRRSTKIPVVVVLDNVRSLHNVGSIFRTADAFRIEAVWLCGMTGCPPSAEIHKTALGAENSVKWKYFSDTLKAIDLLHKKDYEVWSVEQVEGSIKVLDMNVERNKKYALVFGHEVFGVDQNVVNVSDGAIEIPQYGTKHSLNVSVAAGIVLYEIIQKFIL